MATTDTVNVELAYTDHTERTYKIPFNGEKSAEGYNAVKQAIRNFNTAAADSTSAVAQTFLSKSGAPAAGIMNATLVTITEDVIYSG